MSPVVHRASRGVLVLFALVLAGLFAGSVQAKSIKKQNIVEIMSHTDSILIGTVAGKTDGFHQGLPYTEITLDVGQSIKGDHGSRYTFRQFGLIEPKPTGDGRVNLMVTPAGWPTYAVGEQVLLFLHKPASVTGFQTTAGLTQGKFTLRGGRLANGVNNESLFAGVRIDRPLSPTHQDLVNQPGGAYAAEDFFSLVRTAVEENWIENGVMTHEN